MTDTKEAPIILYRVDGCWTLTKDGSECASSHWRIYCSVLTIPPEISKQQIRSASRGECDGKIWVTLWQQLWAEGCVCGWQITDVWLLWRSLLYERDCDQSQLQEWATTKRYVSCSCSSDSRRNNWFSCHHNLQYNTFWATVFLRQFYQIWSIFHFIGLHNNNSFTKQALQPCVQLQTWRTWSLYLYRPVTRRPSYIPSQRVPLPSRSTTRKAAVEILLAASIRQGSLISYSYVNGVVDSVNAVVS